MNNFHGEWEGEHTCPFESHCIPRAWAQCAKATHTVCQRNWINESRNPFHSHWLWLSSLLIGSSCLQSSLDHPAKAANTDSVSPGPRFLTPTKPTTRHSATAQVEAALWNCMLFQGKVLNFLLFFLSFSFSLPAVGLCFYWEVWPWACFSPICLACLNKQTYMLSLLDVAGK